MELIIGMALAFVLGAYIRQPFPVKVKREQPKPQPQAKTDPLELTEEQRAYQELMNAMKFDGKKQEAKHNG